jgi:hypothetical protein
MSARIWACLAMGALLSGCPFALEDGYFIESSALPEALPEAGPKPAVPADQGDACPKKGPCRAEK